MISVLFSQVMRACNLKQKDLAVVLDVPLQRIKRLTGGEVQKLTPDETRRLVQKLGLHAHWLATGEGPMFSLGTRLRNERLRINWRDVDMAQHLGCTLADYVALEDGLRALSIQEEVALRNHDELDAQLVLVGASLKRPTWELDEREAVLMTQYRDSSDDGKRAIESTASFAAQSGQRKQA